jgi:hypothetical protein
VKIVLPDTKLFLRTTIEALLGIMVLLQSLPRKNIPVPFVAQISGTVAISS